MKKILSVVMVAFFALTVPALAGIDEGNGEIGFNYGNTDYDNDAGLESSNDLSLRGGFFMTRMFEIEGQYINSDAEVTGTTVEADMSIMMVNGVFNFRPTETITPYFLVGLGRADIEVNVPGNPDDSGMAYQFGGGTRWFFGKAQRAALRFDLSFVNEDVGDTGSRTHRTLAGGFTWRLGN